MRRKAEAGLWKLTIAEAHEFVRCRYGWPTVLEAVITGFEDIMQPPSIALTLVVSFALSVAALSYVQDIARGAQDPAAAAARQCDG